MLSPAVVKERLHHHDFCLSAWNHGNHTPKKGAAKGQSLIHNKTKHRN